jgi:hypothetical protein
MRQRTKAGQRSFRARFHDKKALRSTSENLQPNAARELYDLGIGSRRARAAEAFLGARPHGRRRISRGSLERSARFLLLSVLEIEPAERGGRRTHP